MPGNEAIATRLTHCQNLREDRVGTAIVQGEEEPSLFLWQQNITAVTLDQNISLALLPGLPPTPTHTFVCVPSYCVKLAFTQSYTYCLVLILAEVFY